MAGNMRKYKRYSGQKSGLNLICLQNLVKNCCIMWEQIKEDSNYLKK